MAGFDVAGARKAGYSDDEIAQHLASDTNTKFDVGGALKSGYSSKEVLDHLTGADKDTGFVSAAKAGVGGYVSGLGETAKQLGATGVGEKLKSIGGSTTPENYAGTPRFVGEGSNTDEGNLHKAGRVVAEQSGPMALGLTAMKMAPGGVWGKLAAGAGVGLASLLGTRMAEQAQPGQDPTLLEKAKGAGVAGLESVVGAAPGLRLVGGAPARSVTQAAGRALTTAGLEGAAGAGREAVAEVGRGKKLSELNLDDLSNAAISQAIASAPFAGPRASKDIEGALRYRKFEGNNAASSARVADMMSSSLGDESMKPGIVNAKTRKGFEIARDVDDLTQEKLGRAVKDFENNGGQFTPAAKAAIDRARQGKTLSERDHDVIDRSLQGNSAGTALADSVRDVGVVAMLKKQGNYNPAKETFTGGLSGAVGKHVNGANFAKAGLAHLLAPGIIAMSPQLAGAAAGAYGVGRIGGKFTGNSNPANRFMERFQTGGAPAAPTPQQQPQQPGARPTGPLVPPAPQPWGPTPPQMTPQPPAPNVPAVPALVAQLNQMGGPGFGLAKPPQGFANELGLATRALNKISKKDGKLAEQKLASDRADAERTNADVDQAPALIRGLAAMQRQKDASQQVVPVNKPYTPGDFPPDVINAGAPQPQRMLPPPDANRAIPMPAPEPQKLLPPPQSQVAARSLASNPAFAEFLAKMKQQPEAQGPAQPDTPDALAALLSSARGQARLPQPAPVAAPVPVPPPAPQAPAPVPPVMPRAAPAAAPARSPELMALLNASLAKEKAAKLTPPPAGDIDLTIPDFLKRTAGVKPEPAPAKPALKVEENVGATSAARLVRRGFKAEQVAEMSNATAQRILKHEYSPAEASAMDLVKAPKGALSVEEPKAPAPPPPALKGERRSWEGVTLSKTFRAEDGPKKTVSNAQEDWLSGKGGKLPEDVQKKGLETIERIYKEKAAITKKVTKALDFDTEDTNTFMSAIWETRNLTAGRQLREQLKARHPEKVAEIDKVLSDAAFASIYPNRKKKDGAPKKS